MTKEYVPFQAQLEGVAAMGSAASHLVLQSLVAQAANVVEALVTRNAQLSGNLSLAEDGLASAGQQIIDLENSGQAMQAEIERLQPFEKAALYTQGGGDLAGIQQARLTWALACQCTCDACETLNNAIQKAVGGSPEPSEQPIATPGAILIGEDSVGLGAESSRPRELQPSGQDFDKDLAHLDGIRKTMADMKRYGSLQGIPMREAEFLLSFIDNLWREYSRSQRRAEPASRDAPKILCTCVEDGHSEDCFDGCCGQCKGHAVKSGEQL